MNDDAKVNISAKAEITGEVPSDAMGRAVHALTDAVSPFTEGMGLIGDHIRVHRYDVAEKIVKRAKALTVLSGNQIKPPPLKFVVPFLEKASTEIDTDELCEIWARLLADASDNFKSTHLTFVQILSEIGGPEVRYLNALAGDYASDSVVQPTRQTAKDYGHRLSRILHRLRELNPHEPDGGATTIGKADDLLTHIYGQPIDGFCRPISVSISVDAGKDEHPPMQRGRMDSAAIAYLLERQGLLKIEHIVEKIFASNLKLDLACLTPLGAELVEACAARN